MTPINHPLWFLLRGPLGSFPHPLVSTSKLNHHVTKNKRNNLRLVLNTKLNLLAYWGSDLLETTIGCQSCLCLFYLTFVSLMPLMQVQTEDAGSKKRAPPPWSNIYVGHGQSPSQGLAPITIRIQQVRFCRRCLEVTKHAESTQPTRMSGKCQSTGTKSDRQEPNQEGEHPCFL